VNKLISVFEDGATKWLLKCGNILDEPADVLVCSANVSLNLSGGVGAELLGRYGPAMQTVLHNALRMRTPRAAQRGEIVECRMNDLPYIAVLHAVTMDGWYETTARIVRETVSAALHKARSLGAKKVALSALATGFGNMTLADFAEAIRPLLPIDWSPIEEVCICLLEDYRTHELSHSLSQT